MPVGIAEFGVSVDQVGRVAAVVGIPNLDEILLPIGQASERDRVGDAIALHVHEIVVVRITDIGGAGVEVTSVGGAWDQSLRK